MGWSGRRKVQLLRPSKHVPKRFGLTRPLPALGGLAETIAFTNGHFTAATPTRREPGNQNASVGSERPTPTRCESGTSITLKNGNSARVTSARRKPRKPNKSSNIGRPTPVNPHCQQLSAPSRKRCESPLLKRLPESSKLRRAIQRRLAAATLLASVHDESCP